MKSKKDKEFTYNLNRGLGERSFVDFSGTVVFRLINVFTLRINLLHYLTFITQGSLEEDFTITQGELLIITQYKYSDLLNLDTVFLKKNEVLVVRVSKCEEDKCPCSDGKNYPVGIVRR